MLEAQNLTLSDIQNSGCQRGNQRRANEEEETRTIILEKEGDILSVQLQGFISNCVTEGFDVTPSISGGTDGATYSVSIQVTPILGDLVADCECPFNVSFTLHGLETNSFRFSCWWYDGQVSLTEGEPLRLESITEFAQIDDWYCIIDKVNYTAVIEGRNGTVDDLFIPDMLFYEEQMYTVTGIEEGAFLNSKTIVSISIPPTITRICNYAFAYCSSLKDVYCYIEDILPAIEASAFANTPIANATLHVPATSKDLYKATSPWNGFGSIVALTSKNGSFLAEGLSWVDGFGYEQDGQYKTDDVKLFYYTTAGDTLINNKSYSRILRTRKCKTSDESRIEVRNDNLCFFMREDETGDVWLYAEDKDVFYELSHNTLYEDIAPNLVGRDLFLFNAGKSYALGNTLPLGMSALVNPNGFGEEWECWGTYSPLVETLGTVELLDGQTYPIYNNYFVESIGPLDGPLSGIGSPNSYSLDFRQLFAFYRDNRLIYKNDDYLAALERNIPDILDIVTGKRTEPVSFTQDQMATIILPTEPDAWNGKYYRLDRVEDNQIVFEQERQPRARVPYIIVPDEDFSIDTETLELAGLSADTVKADGIRFIGTYSREELGSKEGFYIDIIDQTPDCSLSPSEETGKGAVVGALRAYLQVPWDEPYSSGSPRSPQQKMEIVLKDKETGSLTPNPSPRRGEVYDLQGRRMVNGKWSRGIYIKDGRKVVEY